MKEDIRHVGNPRKPSLPQSVTKYNAYGEPVDVVILHGYVPPKTKKFDVWYETRGTGGHDYFGEHEYVARDRVKKYGGTVHKVKLKRNPTPAAYIRRVTNPWDTMAHQTTEQMRLEDSIRDGLNRLRYGKDAQGRKYTSAQREAITTAIQQSIERLNALGPV